MSHLQFQRGKKRIKIGNANAVVCRWWNCHLVLYIHCIMIHWYLVIEDNVVVRSLFREVCITYKSLVNILRLTIQIFTSAIFLNFIYFILFYFEDGKGARLPLMAARSWSTCSIRGKREVDDEGAVDDDDEEAGLSCMVFSVGLTNYYYYFSFCRPFFCFSQNSK